MVTLIAKEKAEDTSHSNSVHSMTSVWHVQWAHEVHASPICCNIA